MADAPSTTPIVVGLNAVIVAVTAERPRVLTVQRPGRDGDEVALPFGPLDAERDRTLELAVRGWVREQAGVEVGYVEQLYTFGDRHRDPRERLGGPRVISIGYLSLALEAASSPGAGASWRDWYDFLPWEDWRGGRPRVLAETIEPALRAWSERADSPTARRGRSERMDIAFGLGGAPWDGYRVLDRYELLYEAGLVAEAHRDAGSAVDEGPGADGHGRTMRFDHRRILATAIQRLRGKIKYRPVVFEL
ncbi:MAG: NAD regulator, partial [Acidobacteriota bacterium]